MKKTMLILAVAVLGCSLSTAHGTLVDITVSTDKPVYNFNEDVIVTVTATNPNPYSVTLSINVEPTVSYLMDDLFDWADGRTGLPAHGGVYLIRYSLDHGKLFTVLTKEAYMH